MIGPGDDLEGMTPDDTLDDEAIEAFFRRDPDPRWEEDDALVLLAEDALAVTSGPPPRPGPALTSIMSGRRGSPTAGVSVPSLPAAWRPPVGVTAAPEPLAGTGRRRPLRWAVRAATAAAATVTSISAAAAAGVLPDAAQRVVAGSVEAVTPFELPEPAAGPAPGPTVVTTAPARSAPLVSGAADGRDTPAVADPGSRAPETPAPPPGPVAGLPPAPTAESPPPAAATGQEPACPPPTGTVTRPEAGPAASGEAAASGEERRRWLSWLDRCAFFGSSASWWWTADSWNRSEPRPEATARPRTRPGGRPSGSRQAR